MLPRIQALVLRQICMQSGIKGSANEADLEQIIKLLLD